MESGPGFYLSTNIKIAKMYGKYIYTVYSGCNNIFPEKMTRTKLASLLRKLIVISPDVDNLFYNYGDNKHAAIRSAIEMYLDEDTPYDSVQSVWIDWYSGEPVPFCKKLVYCGYDAKLIDLGSEKMIGDENIGSTYNLVVFNPDCLSIIGKIENL